MYACIYNVHVHVCILSPSFPLHVHVCVHVCVHVEDPPTPARETTITPTRLHKRNERGETPLHVACIKGDLRLAVSLIEQGAEVNATDHAGLCLTCTCIYTVYMK